MKNAWLAGLIVALFLPQFLAAKDLSGLYDQGKLKYWQGRYSENLLWNYRNVILPVLIPQDRNALRGLKIRFPLVGEIGGDPLEYYSGFDRGKPVVVIPVLSVKFFDDLAIAIAWMDTNGYSMGTVTDWVTMLKYLPPRRFPGGRYLPPLKTLQIPSNATENSKVDELSQKILKSAIIWIMGHELGHVLYRHPGYKQGASPEQVQANEAQADRFATEMMRRVGVAPVGLAYFFTIAIHWLPNRSDFSTQRAWRDFISKANHPLSTERLRQLAIRIKSNAQDFARKEPNYTSALRAINSAANDIGKLSQFLANEELQGTIKRKAILTSQLPDPFKPRRR